MSLSVATWLKQSEAKLQRANIPTAHLDALVLLRDCLNKNSVQLLAYPELRLTAAQEHILDRQVARRTRHEPLAYIRGKSEFYGREFIITKAVLEPRPESETMIDILKELPSSKGFPEAFSHTTNKADMTKNRLSKKQSPLCRKMFIADIGTGSGALGITATLELPSTTVDLLEIDRAAIKVAKSNVIKFATHNKVIESNLLAFTPQSYDILLCNLPYVPSNFYINPAALNEPKIAIFGGPDGLNVYRQLFEQLAKLDWQPKYILTEALPPQHPKLAQIAKQAGFNVTRTEDFIQLFEPL